MGQNRRILGSVWAFGHGAWRSLRAALAGTEGEPTGNESGAGRTDRRLEVDAEARRLKAQLRQSGFSVPPQKIRQRAAGRLCLVIDERGKDDVERVLMKASRG